MIFSNANLTFVSDKQFKLYWKGPFSYFQTWGKRIFIWNSSEEMGVSHHITSFGEYMKIKLGTFSVERNCASKCTPAGRELVIELTHKQSLEFFRNLYDSPQ